MGTRATYSFKSEDYNTTLYVHKDNYPSGAAEKFREMLTVNKNRGSAINFIISNDDAHITLRPSYHWDTAYHYLIEEKDKIILTAYKYETLNKNHRRSMSEFYKGSIEDFIEKFKSE